MKLPVAYASIYYRGAGANNSAWTFGGAYYGATPEPVQPKLIPYKA